VCRLDGLGGMTTRTAGLAGQQHALPAEPEGSLLSQVPQSSGPVCAAKALPAAEGDMYLALMTQALPDPNRTGRDEAHLVRCQRSLTKDPDPGRNQPVG